MSAHANWRELFDKVEFYRVDIRILKELGHEVVLSGTPGTLDWKADLYFCWWWGHSPFPLLAGKLRRRPVVVTGAFDYSTCRKEIPGLCYLDRPWWQKLVLRSSLLLADRNLFISKSECEEVTSNLPVKNPVYATLAIDTEFYSPGEAPSAESDYFFTVTWTSRTNAIRKGLIPTIEAFAEVAKKATNLRLVVAGKHGDYLDELKNLAHRLGVADRVEFVGMISDEEKLEHYRKCLAYVQPTLYEGFGHAIGEALACGARVITSPRGAVPEVAGEFAYWVQPDSQKEIAAAMEMVVATPIAEGEAQARHQWISSNYSIASRRAALKSVLDSLSPEKKG
ncbi:glycosyltransferase family 4 protein [Pseudomonas chlororaphis]|uniref:glycosyltransferase family 4 protein n=1 Tax=Pseudomonas chlororaphis TaxID=587753 RepID=UPI0023677A03|nr:glycosyltransferase family 4 protein [Pseudomonas chlororaphis]WDG76774.1 glycosyltransferase family 4 protein [Pseudomonas chlororaphis]WDG83986.1 glycosyltransferase family 4 protein [Pseudomonas chlororaphis]